ncbi:MAG: PDZ domain-containing protein [Pyrinomonadaceae bacterium]
MFNKNNLLTAALLAASTAAAAFAQQTSPIPTAPQSPQRIERQMQIFTNDGGGYLGVQSQDVTKENFSKFGLREVRGVAIEKVLENSPAAQAGLQTGDVIIKIDGEEVTSAKKLTRLISEVAPDHQVKITVLRAGGERELTATIGKRPAPEFGNGSFTMPAPESFGQQEFQLRQMPQIQSFPPQGMTIIPPADDNQNPFIYRANGRQIGVGITPLNNQLGDYFGVTDGRGLLINNVRENSPAAKAGLKAGDVIVETDGKTVNSAADLTRAINEKKEGDVNLTIIRNKNRQTIRVTPEKSAAAPQNFIFQNDGTPGARQQRQLQMLPPPEDDSAPQLRRQSAPRVQ